MTTREQVIQAVYAAVDRVNQELPADGRLEKRPDAVVLGPGGVLDSLALLNLIVAIDQAVEEAFDVSIDLPSAVSGSQGFLATLGAVVGHIEGLLGSGAEARS